MVEPRMSTDSLSRTFFALADPTRRAILTRLGRGQASVTELAKPFKLSLPAVSKHLKVLERGGLISRGRDAQWRPCKLESRPLREAADWMESVRRDWEAHFDRLEAYLHELQKAEEAVKATPATKKTAASPGGRGASARDANPSSAAGSTSAASRRRP
jgi:DNA-binding transcriptional ArsR family regulator